MKKTLSMILAFVMVATLALTVMPMSAFAASGTYVGDEAAIAAGMYFRIGELDAENGNVYASTLADMITAAQAAGDGVVVYLIRDFTNSERFSMNATANFKNMTVDGGGHNWTNNFKTNYHNIVGFESFTLKNFGIMDWNSGIIYGTSGNILYKDIVEFSAADRPVASIRYGTLSLTLDNANLYQDTCETSSRGPQPCVRLGWDASTDAAKETPLVTLNVLNNSSITYRGDQGPHQTNGSAVFVGNIITANITVDGTSEIVLDHATDGTCRSAAINANIDGTVNLTLENGARLVQKGSADDVAFVRNANAVTVNITDNGCEYVVAKDAANGMAIFPTFEGKKFVSGNTDVISGGTYTKTAAQTTDLAFKSADATAITNDAEAVANGMFFRVGEVDNKEYAGSMSDALKLAAAGDTIYLLANGYILNSETVFSVKDLTIDGQGFKMGLTAGYGINVRATGFKLHNITIDTNVQIMSVNPVGAGAEFLVTLDNVNLKTTKGIIVNYNHNRNSVGMAGLDTLCKLVVSDSTLVGDTNAFEDVILLNKDTNFDVDIKNSTLKVANSQDATTWGRVLAVSGSTTGKVDINVENSTLESAYNKKSQLIAIVKDTDVNITLDNRTKLVLSAAASTDKYAEFILGKSKTVINDNGATYTASASVIKAATDGVALPTYAPEGTTVIGYTSGDALYTAKYVDANATEAKSFKAFAFGKDDFVMVDGAAIRTTAPYGIRFTSYVNSALLAALGDRAEFGMIITPYANAFNQDAFVNIGDLDASKYAKIVGENLKDATVDEVAVKQLLAAVYMQNDENLTTAGKTQFETKMAACAYLTVTYADGTTATFWTDYSGSKNARSLYDVAKAYYEDTRITDGSNKSNATINNILTTCGYTLDA